MMNKKKKQSKKVSMLNRDPEQSRGSKESLERKGRSLSGIVVSDKMDKTIVVLVDRYKEHPKYKKRFKISKRYKADDQKNEYKEGDKVIIHEVKPISKDKKWIVNKKI